jgi:TfoX/Sxy family transcriptional regulator of competence genes
MAYNLELANRVTSELNGVPAIEKKMFGGVGFLLHGNMACGVIGDGLIVRVPPEKHTDLLKRPHVKPFDFSGKPMKGWLVVEAPGYKSAAQLSKWVKESVDFALTLPPK